MADTVNTTWNGNCTTWDGSDTTWDGSDTTWDGGDTTWDGTDKTWDGSDNLIFSPKCYRIGVKTHGLIQQRAYNIGHKKCYVVS